jgi:hypothetical protein
MDAGVAQSERGAIIDEYIRRSLNRRSNHNMRAGHASMRIGCCLCLVS